MKQEDVPFGPGLRASDQRTSGFMMVQETMDFITHYTICKRNARRLTSNGTFETNGTAERMGQPSEWDSRANGTAEQMGLPKRRDGFWPEISVRDATSQHLAQK